MTSDQLQSLLPLLILAATAVAVLAFIAARRHHGAVAALTVAGLAGTIIAALGAAPGATQVAPLLLIDGFTRFYVALIAGASLAVALLSYGYLKQHEVPPEELYLLLLLAALGGGVMAGAVHFVSFFLGLELLTVSLYAMIGYLRDGEESVEAAVKYLILAAVSSAFLLFGMALVYARTGDLALAAMSPFVAAGFSAEPMVGAGLALMMVGVAFKLALVPFHLWTPDVYEGAPSPVSAFVATVSKGAVAAFLVRFSLLTGAGEQPAFILLVGLLAGASMLAGNLLALRQSNVKRILAYSSIAHLGYLLVAFVAGGRNGAAAVTFYLTAYFITMLGAFAVVTALSGAQRDAGRISDFSGLGFRRPAIAAVLTAMLLSLAGIPLTAGFVGKFLVLAAGAAAARWALILVLVLSSVISLYYYLRIVGAMYFGDAPEERSWSGAAGASLAGGVTLAGLTLGLVWIGVWPAPLMGVIRSAVAALW